MNTEFNNYLNDGLHVKFSNVLHKDLIININENSSLILELYSSLYNDLYQQLYLDFEIPSHFHNS